MLSMLNITNYNQPPAPYFPSPTPPSHLSLPFPIPQANKVTISHPHSSREILHKIDNLRR